MQEKSPAGAGLAAERVRSAALRVAVLAAHAVVRHLARAAGRGAAGGAGQRLAQRRRLAGRRLGLAAEDVVQRDLLAVEGCRLVLVESDVGHADRRVAEQALGVGPDRHVAAAGVALRLGRPVHQRQAGVGIQRPVVVLPEAVHRLLRVHDQRDRAGFDAGLDAAADAADVVERGLAPRAAVLDEDHAFAAAGADAEGGAAVVRDDEDALGFRQQLLDAGILFHLLDDLDCFIHLSLRALALVAQGLGVLRRVGVGIDRGGRVGGACRHREREGAGGGESGNAEVFRVHGFSFAG